MSPIPESDSKRLRRHTPVLPDRADITAEKARLDAVYDDAAALGESEESYSAAQRLLDEAVDQAVREEYPSGPALKRKNAPPAEPEPPDDEYEPLKFGRVSIEVSQIRKRNTLRDKWHMYLWLSNYEQSFEAAALDMADALAEAAHGLREMVEGRQHAQPSVTAATSAALIQNYAGKEVSP